MNSVTHQDAYPLPRIYATLDSVASSVFFTTVNLASGYWQVELVDEAREKTAFSTPIAHLQAVFQRLQQAGLKLQTNKCHFAKREVHYLRHIVGAEGVKPDPGKTEAVSSYLIPQNVHELRQFLGLANYYRRFVKGYSQIAEPHYQLTRKTSKGFVWSPNCQAAFVELKHCLTTPPILGYPDLNSFSTLMPLQRPWGQSFANRTMVVNV